MASEFVSLAWTSPLTYTLPMFSGLLDFSPLEVNMSKAEFLIFSVPNLFLLQPSSSPVAHVKNQRVTLDSFLRIDLSGSTS